MHAKVVRHSVLEFSLSVATSTKLQVLVLQTFCCPRCFLVPVSNFCGLMARASALMAENLESNQGQVWLLPQFGDQH